MDEVEAAATAVVVDPEREGGGCWEIYSVRKTGKTTFYRQEINRYLIYMHITEHFQKSIKIICIQLDT